MQTYAKISIIAIATLILLVGAGCAINSYTSTDAVWSRTEARYSRELEEAEATIQDLRHERTETERLWRDADASLSGQINTLKARTERLQLCLSAHSVDCDEGDSDSMLSLVSGAYASDLSAGSLSGDLHTTTDRGTLSCTIGTGSHDVRPLAYQYPNVAGWKNNNTSGLTLGSKALEQAMNDAGITWFIGSARPANEGSNYYGFPDLENGLRAKMLMIRRSYQNSTIATYLTRWGTDSISTPLDTSRTIASLSDSELTSLVLAQIEKESGVEMAEYVRENVLVCNS